MKYNILIIDSENPYNYFDNSAEGIRYDNLSKEEFETILNLSLNQNFSVIVYKYEEEE